MKKKPSLERRARYLLLVLFLLCLPFGYYSIKASANTAFLGDSITQRWIYPSVNLGVYGNTTAQMLARFPTQIPGHHYQSVVILGGTNDVLLRIDPSVTIHNLEEIGNYAVQAGAQPVLCEVPPIFHSLDPRDEIDYSYEVRMLNHQIIRLAAAHKWKLIDYYDPLLNHPGLSSDGVHLKHLGYIVMEWTYLKEAPSS